MEKKLSLYVEPSAFFQERVSEVMSRQKFATIPIAEFYLVDLLARYMTVNNLFDKDPDLLATMFLKAQSKEVPGSEKIRILRKLGDTSLYISGFFGDSLNRKIIDLDYYRDMGAIAYRSLADTIRDDQFHTLYNELHSKFVGFVNILSEISHEVSIQSNQDLLSLYDSYVRTGNEYAKKQLSEKGLPIPPFIQNNADTTALKDPSDAVIAKKKKN